MIDLIELGKKIEGSLRPGMMRQLYDGTLRPVTNIEMAAYTALRRKQDGFSKVSEPAECGDPPDRGVDGE
jgi:hypothetical protein